MKNAMFIAAGSHRKNVERAVAELNEAGFLPGATEYECNACGQTFAGAPIVAQRGSVPALLCVACATDPACHD